MMYTIENYLEGKLNKVSLTLFERKLKKNTNFRKKVELFKNVDLIMKGGIMATNAEKEMIEKKIDVVAAGLVSDFIVKNDKPENIDEFLCWS